MNFAMAFCGKDRDQVQRWLTWAEELGWNTKHRLFLMPVKGLAADFKTGIPFTVVQDGQGITTDWGADDKSAVRDAAGPNSMFRQFCWFFHPTFRPGNEPWTFIESDCIPIRANWADEWQFEYQRCGKPFMAAFVKGTEGLFPDHATGNMILPAKAAEMSKLLTLPSYVTVEGSTRSVEYAFDVAAAPDILPQCHFTRLLQHVFRGPKFDKMDHLDRLDPCACLWHTDKDGGLINLLRRRKNGETAKTGVAQLAEQPSPERPVEGSTPSARAKPRVHTYFRPCVDPEALDEQKRILWIWEKNWREHGWEPVILTEAHARKHPEFERLEKAFMAMPTVSPKEYELAAFYRWPAMYAVGGGFLTDYDVLNNGWKPELLGEAHEFPLILSDKNPVPCAVVGTAEQYQTAIRAFLTCPIGEEQGQPHLSDMLAVQKLKFPAKDVCREFAAAGWENAPLLHFNHRRCGKDRSRAMQDWVDGRLSESIVSAIEFPPPINGNGPDKRPIMEEIRERLVWIKDNSRGITRHHVHRELKALGLLPKK